MNNQIFLSEIKKSFVAYLKVGTSRSTAKLKNLHGSIARDLEEKLGKEFTIHAQGYGDGKETGVDGRYYPKKTDIAIEKNGKPVAGFAIKFIMRNYSQNSNNYFENMLGETANIRSNAIPYFQIFIIFDKVPYFSKKGEFKKYDILSRHNLEKYWILSKDNPSEFFHTPDKTLVVVVHLKEKEQNYIFKDEKDYNQFYKSVLKDGDAVTYATSFSDMFDDSVIYNDYEDFMERAYHIIMGKLKK